MLFFLNDPATPKISPLPLHTALPTPTATAAAVTTLLTTRSPRWALAAAPLAALTGGMLWFFRDPERVPGEGRLLSPADGVVQRDRKSTRLNSSHANISYAVFFL